LTDKESEDAMKSYLKSIFNVSVSMKITGQMSADGAFKVGRMFAVAVQILASGAVAVGLVWAIRWW